MISSAHLMQSKFGLQKVTLVDYPKLVAATIFTSGCNLKCPYCHNSELISGSPPADFISESDLFDYLSKRKSVLGGVCMTGGEPTLFPEIQKIIDKVHNLGLKFKLDTNGTNPQILKTLNPDFIAMDIKTDPSKYNRVGLSCKDEILESIDYIISSGIEHEFRTTCVPTIVEQKDFNEIAKYVNGCDTYSITNFNNTNTLDKSFSNIKPYSKENMSEIFNLLTEKGINCILK